MYRRLEGIMHAYMLDEPIIHIFILLRKCQYIAITININFNRRAPLYFNVLLNVTIILSFWKICI